MLFVHGEILQKDYTLTFFAFIDAGTAIIYRVSNIDAVVN
jgi:hypothetical protein